MNISRLFILISISLTFATAFASDFHLVDENGKKLGPFSSLPEKKNQLENVSITVIKNNNELYKEYSEKSYDLLNSIQIPSFEVKDQTVSETLKKLQVLTTKQIEDTKFTNKLVSKTLRELKEVFSAKLKLPIELKAFQAFYYRMINENWRGIPYNWKFLKDCTRFDPATENYSGNIKVICIVKELNSYLSHIKSFEDLYSEVYLERCFSSLEQAKTFMRDTKNNEAVYYYKFPYKEPKLSIKVENLTLPEILDQICQKTGCTWSNHFGRVKITNREFEQLCDPDSEIFY